MKSSLEDIFCAVAPRKKKAKSDHSRPSTKTQQPSAGLARLKSMLLVRQPDVPLDGEAAPTPTTPVLTLEEDVLSFLFSRLWGRSERCHLPGTWPALPSVDCWMGLQAHWRDNNACSRLSVHSQPLAAMHDAVRVGLECMPAVGPANASLIASQDETCKGPLGTLDPHVGFQTTYSLRLMMQEHELGA